MRIETQGQLPVIDIVKFLMAFCVIAIHVEGIYNMSPYFDVRYPFGFEWLISTAVPFFFIVSGFLLGRRLYGEHISRDDYRKTASGRAWKLFRLFACWLVVYLPIAVIDLAGNGKGLVHNVAVYCWSVAVNGESPYAWPLWFIYSMAWVMLLLSWLRPSRRLLWWVFAGFCLLLLNTWVVTAASGVPKICGIVSTFTSRTLGGGAYIVGGLLLYIHCDKIATLPAGVVLIGTSLVLAWFGLPYSPLTGGSGIFLVGLSARLPEGRGYLVARELSMWIYYTHMLILYALFTRYFQHLLPQPFVLLGCASAATLMLSLGLYRLKEIPGFGWLNRLIK